MMPTEHLATSMLHQERGTPSRRAGVARRTRCPRPVERVEKPTDNKVSWCLTSMTDVHPAHQRHWRSVIVGFGA